jgi:hypothetical protein
VLESALRRPRPAGCRPDLVCEINASSVTPFPPEAVPLLARATAQAVMAARTGVNQPEPG